MIIFRFPFEQRLAAGRDGLILSLGPAVLGWMGFVRVRGPVPGGGQPVISGGSAAERIEWEKRA
jgi:hypothetical protein